MGGKNGGGGKLGSRGGRKEWKGRRGLGVQGKGYRVQGEGCKGGVCHLVWRQLSVDSFMASLV